MKFPFTGKSKLEAQLADTVAQLVVEKEASMKLTAEIETLKSKLAELEANGPEAKEVIKEVVPADITDKLASLEKQNGEYKAELEVAKKAVADFELSVAIKAQDTLAEIGIEKLPVVPEKNTKEEIVAKFHSIKNLQEQRKFYEQNYAVLKDN